MGVNGIENNNLLLEQKQIEGLAYLIDLISIFTNFTNKT